jgi:hypothetical protein
MPAFPVLGSGASVQLPLGKARVWRVVRTETRGGYRSVRGDAGASRIEWRLRYRDLSVAEAGALRQCYAEARGPVDTFAFADPFANLLANATDLSAPVWQAGSLTVAQDGTAGLAGGVPAFRLGNAGGQQAGIGQAVPGEGIAGLCFSVYLRCESEKRIRLTAGQFSSDALAGPLWRRFWVRGEGVVGGVSISVPAASEIWAAAPQAEIQPAPTPFKPSSDGRGVYLKTRFAEAPLRITATGPDSYSAECTLFSLLTE